ncbi:MULTISPECIES: hypothetical protein [unclassified Pseudonocardia]|uniref:hypothetical protein n=1 Tax=unclassified Pseudonocardia TaxID=2619320 RepID=UPI0009649962|nr:MULTISPECIES: hypothetical protein [unclassified Pseudonocardia]MBN9098515.1 hypothetical protein [Pseudonocardia sp.]OJY40524.1 MAG: hypothetical protein BGP03_14785 [Pseudonocardia sp. 73-21]
MAAYDPRTATGLPTEPVGSLPAGVVDGHGRQLSKHAAGPVTRSMPHATDPVEQAVIAPSMLALLHPSKDPVGGCSREEFEAALVDECGQDIRPASAAGAGRVPVILTLGRLATRESPRNPWTGAGLPPHFVELNNRVMARFTAGERVTIDIHTGPGGDRDSVPSAGGHLRSDTDGVVQVAYPGSTVTPSPRVESSQEITHHLVRVANVIDRNQIGQTDDCGFPPFPIDEKPDHGSPDHARNMAFGAIAARVQGSRPAAEKPGL